jgi:hypothetical protein
VIEVLGLIPPRTNGICSMRILRMNKTIYVRDEDVATWEKAKELAGDKLSPIIATALKRYVAEKEAEGTHYARIQLKFNDSNNNDVPRIVSFSGRWIASPEEPFEGALWQ